MSVLQPLLLLQLTLASLIAVCLLDFCLSMRDSAVKSQ